MNNIDVIVNKEVGNIGSNIDEIKEHVSSQMQVYKELEINESNLVERKADRATLNKIIKAIDDQRKTVKKDFMKPYEEFEKECKEVISLINEPVQIIDTQVKKFEEAKKLEKRKHIAEIYGEEIGEYEDIIPLNRIYDTKWENVSTSEKTIREDIKLIVERTAIEITTIKSMDSEFYDKGINKYIDTLNVAFALQEIQSYEKQKAEILAREEAKKKAEEERKEVIPFTEDVFPEDDEIEEEAFEQVENVKNISIDLIATEKEISKLYEFLETHGYVFKISC